MTIKRAVTISLLAITLTGITFGAISYYKHTGKNPLKTYAYNTTDITKTNGTTYEITQNIKEVGNTTQDTSYRINDGKITITANTQNTTQLIVKQDIIQIRSGSQTAGSTSSYFATNTTTISVTNINNISYINYTYGNVTYVPTLKSQIELQLNIFNTTNATPQVKTITFTINDAISTSTLEHITTTANDNNIQYKTLINNYTSNYAEGQTAGYTTGYTDGQTAGYTTGYTDGQTAGYTTGYQTGYDAGEYNGYQEGWNDNTSFSAPVDIRGLMLNILTMPFTFIRQGFNVTMWEGTAYEFNVANFILSLIAIATILFIIRLFTSGFSIIGNYTSSRENRELTRSQTNLNKAKTEKIKKDTK